MALTKTPIELSSTPGIVDNSNDTAITIDSSERVLIGKTATGLGASGTEINPNGYIQVTEDQSPPLYLNRLNTDGNIVNFYKDGLPVGSIGYGAGVLGIGQGTGNLGLFNATVIPMGSTSGAASDGVITLGSGARRFKDIYLSGGVNPTANVNGNAFTQPNNGSDSITAGWISSSFGKNSNKVVIGSHSSQAVVGAHNNDLNGWADLHLQATSIKFLNTSGSQTATITSAGNLLVGTTDEAVWDNATGSGINLRGDLGLISSARTNAEPLMINRMGTDGEIIKLNKNGATVGSIGTEGGRLQIGKGASGIYFYDSGPSVLPWNIGSNAGADNSIDLGSSGTRFKDIYLSGGVNFSANANAAGRTSELLDDYEEGTWTPTLAGYYGTYGTTITQGSSRIGTYTKVGNLVTLSVSIENAGVASANNGDIIVIAGLPFSVSSSANAGSSAHTSIATFVGGAWTNIDTTQLGHLGNNGAANTSWQWLTGSSVGTGGVAIRLTISYRH